MEQKFQIGDICKIINKRGYEKQYLIIVGSKKQLFPNDIENYKFNRYQVFLPKHLNNNLYYTNKEGQYFFQGPNDLWPCKVNKDFEYGWLWVADCDLNLVRKPNKEDLKALYNYALKQDWEEFNTVFPNSWIWDSWEQMANQYIDLTEIKKGK